MFLRSIIFLGSSNKFILGWKHTFAPVTAFLNEMYASKG
jgi:hypothetical protein